MLIPIKEENVTKSKPARPVLRSTAPSVANALGALDAAKPVTSTPPVLDAPKAPAPAPSTAVKPPHRTANLSVSVTIELRDRIDAVAYEQKLGKTAIVEGALAALFEGRTNAEIADALREGGHGFKRRT